MHTIEVTPTGYTINFTRSLSAAQQASFDKLAITSWYYNEDTNYGSAEIDA